jgi:hypothetical protein
MLSIGPPFGPKPWDMDQPYVYPALRPDRESRRIYTRVLVYANINEKASLVIGEKGLFVSILFIGRQSSPKGCKPTKKPVGVTSTGYFVITKKELLLTTLASKPEVLK